MAGAECRPRRGPAPIASFDHDVSDESSPENKQAARLPEIREDPSCSSGGVHSLAPPELRARSHSSPAVHAAPPPALQAPPAPRIDISRASSSSHHDSRDSSPELALFAGDDARARLDLGFREDGALELRSSTEELAFLEGAPGGPVPVAAPTAPPSRRHSRKDSQGSEAALLGVSGRTSRLSSVGSQCSAQSALSALSRASHLSALSAASRSPSPHKMLLETSFCGPKPIETDPEICAAAVEERLLEIAQLQPVDARDRREVRTEATVESTRPPSAPRLASPAAPPPTPAPPLPCAPPVAPAAAPPVPPPATPPVALDDDKLLKETRNRAAVEERRARPRDRLEPSQPEVFERGNRTKDIIRIKLKPDDEYDHNDDDESERTLTCPEAARKPATLRLAEPAGPPAAPHSRTPSPAGVAPSRKSSFCSLFKSRETIASPDSPCDALQRKKSLNEGRSRSKSRDRSATPTSAGKIKGSVLSLFKTPRRSGTSPSASSRDVSPAVQPPRQFPQPPPERARAEKLKYYEQAENGIIHIPLRTPPDELDREHEAAERAGDAARPASAPQPRAPLAGGGGAAPVHRTVLPDGSIIIPLHSPTERPARASAPCSPTFDSTCAGRSELAPRAGAPELPVAAPESPEGDPDAPRPSPERSPPADISPAAPAVERPRRKERIVFTTHVGSKEQVFSTQFSITKTPSVTSDISESIPSFPESDEGRPDEPGAAEAGVRSANAGASPARSSSGSEASSEGAHGSDAERRGLVVQESFEELPYVPTTLPLERSLALPMVPVRERAGVRTAPLQRPRAARPSPAPLPALPAPRAPPPAPDAARLHIRLPRRASATAVAPPPRSARARSRSGSEGTEARGAEARGKGAWIDFSEVPERRKQAKRIQTLPAAARDAVLVSYVPPERCRCECHAHGAERDAPHNHAAAEPAYAARRGLADDAG